MAKKTLFDTDFTKEWPNHHEFPINEITVARTVKDILINDINESNEFLIITGFTSLRNIIEVFGAKDFSKLKHCRIVIGFDPEEKVGKNLPHYSLKWIFNILAMNGYVLGNNTEAPQEGIYKRYLKNGLSTEKMIKAYKNYTKNDGEWEGVKDSTQHLYSLIYGKEALINQKIYDDYKDVDASIKTAISIVESNTEWSFFAFRGDSKRSPKWLLLDDKGEAITDFPTICDKLKYYLKNNTIVQKRWKEVDASVEIHKIIYKLRKQEIEILPWKKKRALNVAKILLKKWYTSTPKTNTARREKLRSISDLFDNNPEDESILDFDQFAEQWLFIFLPVLDEMRRKQRRRRSVLSLNDLIESDFVISDSELESIFNNCQYSESLDELIAACIIAVQTKNQDTVIELNE